MEKVIWTRDESKERFPEPISPLGWSILQDSLKMNLVQVSHALCLRKLNPDAISRRIHCWVYARKDFFSGKSIIYFISPKILFRIPSFTLYVVEIFLTYVTFSRNKPPLKTKIQIILWKKLIAPHVDRLKRDFEKDINQAIANLKQSQIQDEPLSHSELLSTIRTLEGNTHKFMVFDFPIYFAKMIVEKYLSWVLKTTLTPEGFSQKDIQNSIAALAFLAPNITISALKNKTPTEHLTPNWDIAKASLETIPFLKESAKNQTSTQTYLSELIANKLYHLLNTQPHLSFILKETIPLFKDLVAWDEIHRFYSSQQFPVTRKLFLAIGKELVSKKYFSEDEDIFYLTLDEIKHYLNTGHIDTADIKTRKEEMQRAEQTVAPMDLTETSSQKYTCVQKIQAEPEAALRGITGCGGIAQGTIHIVRTIEHAKMSKSNHVALLRSPNPILIGLLPKVRGIICETGGILSHGALLARELDIPTILSVPYAEQMLPPGTFVTMDADHAVITANSGAPHAT